jgi:hypothetical protein
MEKIKALAPFAIGAALGLIAVVTGINFTDALGIVTSADAGKAFCDALAAKEAVAP